MGKWDKFADNSAASDDSSSQELDKEGQIATTTSAQGISSVDGVHHGTTVSRESVTKVQSTMEALATTLQNVADKSTAHKGDLKSGAEVCLNTAKALAPITGEKLALSTDSPAPAA